MWNEQKIHARVNGPEVARHTEAAHSVRAIIPASLHTRSAHVSVRLRDAAVVGEVAGNLRCEEEEAETPGSHVLVVDDDAEVCGRLSAYLAQHDFRVTVVNSRREMLEVIGREAIDLLVLEPRLRGGEGLGLTRSIRETSKLPIVVLSGLDDEADRVMGLELGADDYVTKPFSARELLARIRAVLRRSQAEVQDSCQDKTVRAYRFAGWELNVKLHRLQTPDGRNVPISRGEFSMLCALLASPQQMMSRERLLDLSRLHSTEVYDRTVDVQILRLRRKIEIDPSNPKFIRTERGTGYYFDARVTRVR